MCEIKIEENLKSVPVILTDDTLNFYAKNVRGFKIFDQAMELPYNWYNIDDINYRVLTKRQ